MKRPVTETPSSTTTGSESLSFEVITYDDPVAVELIKNLQKEFVVRYGGPDETPVHPEQFSAPHGLFLVGRLGGVPVACGGWRRLPDSDPPAGEIKRMYVDAGFRGRGLSRQVLHALESTAREAGLRRLQLETGDKQPEAIGLYLATGWQRIPSYGYYADEPGSQCFGKDL
jgi:GNAT superfamily N-acetyltransferase